MFDEVANDFARRFPIAKENHESSHNTLRTTVFDSRLAGENDSSFNNYECSAICTYQDVEPKFSLFGHYGKGTGRPLAP